MLAALLKKTGTGKDRTQLRRRRRLVLREVEAKQRARERALLEGRILNASNANEIERGEFVPILIIVPPSVMENWLNEAGTWGHFGVAKYHGASRSLALERIRNGSDEILVCGKSLFNQPDDVTAIKTIAWKLIVVDEFHQYKVSSLCGCRGCLSAQSRSLIGYPEAELQN